MDRVWADMLRFLGAMIKKKAKAQKAADVFNEYVRRELPGTEYSNDEVPAKIDNITAKARKYYTIYQRPRETRRGVDEDDISIDLEAAVMAWPNFRTFLTSSNFILPLAHALLMIPVRAWMQKGS